MIYIIVFKVTNFPGSTVEALSTVDPVSIATVYNLCSINIKVINCSTYLVSIKYIQRNYSISFTLHYINFGPYVFHPILHVFG